MREPDEAGDQVAACFNVPLERSLCYRTLLPRVTAAATTLENPTMGWESRVEVYVPPDVQGHSEGILRGVASSLAHSLDDCFLGWLEGLTSVTSESWEEPSINGHVMMNPLDYFHWTSQPERWKSFQPTTSKVLLRAGLMGAYKNAMILVSPVVARGRVYSLGEPKDVGLSRLTARTSVVSTDGEGGRRLEFLATLQVQAPHHQPLVRIHSFQGGEDGS